MKASELRIGNWVFSEETESNFVIDEHSFSAISVEHIDAIKPIPLTEEWLDSMEDDGSFRLKYIKSIDAFEVEREYVSFEKEEWIFISNCRYRHEWQNLHFALTGEELKEKEE